MLKTKRLWSIIFASFLLYSPAQANTLDENQIRYFLERENTLLKDNAGKTSASSIKDYLEKHLSKNFTYADEVKSSLGQFGHSSETLKYNRHDYIENIVTNISGLKGIKSTLSIKNINISNDGQSARVKYKTVARLDADGSHFQQNGAFGLNTSSDCETNLVWNIYEKAIQTERLVCATEAKMELPEGF